MDSTKHLTEVELAQRFACSPATLQRHRSLGIGVRFLKLHGQVRYRLQDVLDFEERALRNSTSEWAGM